MLSAIVGGHVKLVYAIPLPPLTALSGDAEAPSHRSDPLTGRRHSERVAPSDEHRMTKGRGG